MTSMLLLVALLSVASVEARDSSDTLRKREELRHEAHERMHLMPDMFAPPGRSGRNPPPDEGRNLKEARSQVRAEREAYDLEIDAASPEKIDELFVGLERERGETAAMFAWWCADHAGSLGCLRRDLEELDRAAFRPPLSDRFRDDQTREERIAENTASKQARKDLRDTIRKTAREQRGDKRGRDLDEFAEMHEAWCARAGNGGTHPCAAWKAHADEFRRGIRGGKVPL